MATGRIRLRGLTLLELLAVVAVVGILASLSVPAYSAVRTRAEGKAKEATLAALIRDAQALAALEGRGYVTAADLETAASETDYKALAAGLSAAAGSLSIRVGGVSDDPSVVAVEVDEAARTVRAASTTRSGVCVVGEALGLTPPSFASVAGVLCSTDAAAPSPGQQDDGQQGGSGYAAAVEASAPVFWLRFDEPEGAAQAVDAVSGFSGTPQGGVEFGKAGVSGSAVQLDGVSGRIVFDYDWRLAPSGPFSIEAWVHPQGGNDWRAVYAAGPVETKDGGKKGKEGGSGDEVEPKQGFVLYAGHPTDPEVRGRWYGRVADDGEVIGDVMGPPAYEQWTHVVMTFDGSKLRLWVNGQLADVDDFDDYVPNGSFPISLGAVSDLSGSARFFFRGLVDELAVYDRALPQSEIQAHIAAAGS